MQGGRGGGEKSSHVWRSRMGPDSVGRERVGGGEAECRVTGRVR